MFFAMRAAIVSICVTYMYRYIQRQYYQIFLPTEACTHQLTDPLEPGKVNAAGVRHIGVMAQVVVGVQLYTQHHVYTLHHHSISYYADIVIYVYAAALLPD